MAELPETLLVFTSRAQQRSGFSGPLSIGTGPVPGLKAAEQSGLSSVRQLSLERVPPYRDKAKSTAE